MRAFVNKAREFCVSTEGPTATEYAIMLALIILVAVGAISGIGSKASSVFSAVDGSIAVPGSS